MTTMQRYADRALDAHLWLFEWHHRHPATQQIVENLLSDHGRGGAAVWNRVLHEDVLDPAQTWTATPDMMNQIVEGVEFLYEEGVDDLVLTRDHVPAPEGVVIFPYGVEVPVDPGELTITRFLNGEEFHLDTSGGDRWMIDGFAWRVAHVAVTEGSGTDDPVPPEEIPLRPGWHWTDGIEFYPITRWRERADDRPFRLGQSLGMPEPPWVFSDSSAWAFNRALDAIDPAILAAEVVEHTSIRMRLLVWLYFAFARDILPARQKPSRAAARRAKPVLGSTNTDEEPAVLVVRLRREAGESTPPNDGEAPLWRFRWMVQPHSARRRVAIRDEHGRPVGPVRGPDAVLGETFEYRIVQIDSFMKGPEDRPFRGKHKVHVLAD